MGCHYRCCFGTKGWTSHCRRTWRFLRENKIAAAILTVLRLYLGYEFLIAGYHKLAAGGFDTSGFLKGAIANPVKGPDGSIVYATYVGFLKHFALPNAHLFNTIVPLGEFLVGLGLILGCLTTAAAFFTLVMNFSYVMAGTILLTRFVYFWVSSL